MIWHEKTSRTAEQAYFAGHRSELIRPVTVRPIRDVGPCLHISSLWFNPRYFRFQGALLKGAPRFQLDDALLVSIDLFDYPARPEYQTQEKQRIHAQKRSSPDLYRFSCL